MPVIESEKKSQKLIFPWSKKDILVAKEALEGNVSIGGGFVFELPMRSMK